MPSRTMIMSRVWRSNLVRIGGTLVLLGMAGMAAAQSKDSPAELASRIDRLIQELDDEEFLVRGEAATALIKIGSPAVAKLTAATKDASPGRRQRAAGILDDIAWDMAGME